ncbi:hypothetical protein [Micromonospora violae]|uniref:hypothetical protein n=1 Tax=Micromonospora violae TaxID=1278207 RepID=UPI00102C763A|nr:hypothetical protein [Micromonospora violae]
MNLYVTRLADMRAEIDQAELKAVDREDLERAYAAARKEWRVHRKKKYRAGIKARDESHDELVDRAKKAGLRELLQLKADLEEGRLTPQEAEGKMRDFVAEHGRLSDLHRSLTEDGDRLADLFAMPLDEFRSRQQRT